jgi:hypothetical protein
LPINLSWHQSNIFFAQGLSIRVACLRMCRRAGLKTEIRSASSTEERNNTSRFRVSTTKGGRLKESLATKNIAPDSLAVPHARRRAWVENFWPASAFLNDFSWAIQNS